MTKVITYGTYDLLHYGHIKLLERAKALGDYLIVGVTSENYDRSRGKLLVQQSLSERIEAVKATGLADEIIIEEYDGQKIDDIKKYGIDIFTVGSDWKGKFDYLNDYCRVVYLERTKGISSTELRSKGNEVKIGIIGESPTLKKFVGESMYISGASVTDIFVSEEIPKFISVYNFIKVHDNLRNMFDSVDAVYIISSPETRIKYAKAAILDGKHVIIETPISLNKRDAMSIYQLANDHNVILCEALKTAYSLAFQRMCLLVRSGIIGKVKGVEATCTDISLNNPKWLYKNKSGGALIEWGSYVIFAVMSILGQNEKSINFISSFDDNNVDIYTKINMLYPNAEASLKVGIGVKSEGDLIISGTTGYIYVPSPWWKMDYFEVRREDFRNNKKYFYQFEGDGIRYELAEFIKCIRNNSDNNKLTCTESAKIAEVIEKFLSGDNVNCI